MGESAYDFLKRAITVGGRVVSSNDLNEWQISEARVKGLFWVDDEGFGWAILPWELTTDKDRYRERVFFGMGVAKIDSTEVDSSSPAPDFSPCSPNLAE